ncbi:MAG TPA: DUF1707 domain-containing protein [Spirochaetales bacterium]|nr:DUF1707 domain-containing protein [Spirochaetales bacterium]HRY56157.1 DUF1707 domain-containing protein [Spirochaetia bacterium]HRZ65628.1 DUF1707 domain-containing protein [Spirochaetia bacterium]
MKDLAKYEVLAPAELRDRVMDELVRHYARESLELEEFERRTELVSRARSKAEILAQVEDLPSLPAEEAPRPAAAGPSRRAAAPGRWRVDGEGGRAQDLSLAIFGGSDFTGSWRAPRQLASICVFGGSKVDLRQAVLQPEGLRISCLCLFGGLDVIVPSGLRVVTRGAGIFGGFDRRDNEPEDRDAPTVVIEGLALFGGVSVKIRD